MKKLGILLFVLFASFFCMISCQYNINNTDNARVLEESYYSILFEPIGIKSETIKLKSANANSKTNEKKEAK